MVLVRRLWFVAIVAMFATSSVRLAKAGFTQTEAAGPEATLIQAAVDSFRASLGSLNPNNGQSFAAGRREINWDAVPDTFADPNLLPGDFFNQAAGGRARGASFSTPGTGFLVTADSSNPSNATLGLGYPADFRPFSAERLFTPIGSLITDVTFFVPGTVTTAATVAGFGVVFSDVELANTTKVEFFNDANDLLLSHFVLREPASGGFSFFGAVANSGERIARVRITTGDEVVFGNNSFGGGSDAVIMDDFIYSEPIVFSAVPEPSTACLLGIAVVACGAYTRLRRTTARKA